MEKESNGPASEAWQKIQEAHREGKKAAFLKYCRDIIDWKEKEKEKVSVHDASYWICSGLAVDELRDYPDTEEIIDLACDLELEKGHDAYPLTPEQAWEKLVGMIKKVHG